MIVSMVLTIYKVISKERKQKQQQTISNALHFSFPIKYLAHGFQLQLNVGKGVVSEFKVP